MTVDQGLEPRGQNAVAHGGWFQRAIQRQKRMSQAFDTLLPAFLRVDGMKDFLYSFVPKYLEPGLKIYDVGGGKHPGIPPATKAELGLYIVGLDIDQRELDLAPPGSYDETICLDVMHFIGRGDGDLVVSSAVLEHVADVEAAMRSIASMLRPGGKALVWVPSRNAAYARLNMLLPELLKLKLLALFRPESVGGEGFKAYYDRCTPNDFVALADQVGLTLQDKRLYYVTNYFSVFFPLYVLWRLWVVLFYLIDREQAAEGFSLALEKVKG